MLEKEIGGCGTRSSGTRLFEEVKHTKSLRPFEYGACGGASILMESSPGDDGSQIVWDQVMSIIIVRLDCSHDRYRSCVYRLGQISGRLPPARSLADFFDNLHFVCSLALAKRIRFIR